MLLRHTSPEVKERKALTINPAKTCQPVGAMYAALGLRGCLPHSHGSQGCAAYHRSALTKHYKEPVMASTSSFTEGSSVFGGQANLLQAINNVFTVYKPDVVAVHTTCLSETIGDDMPQIIAKAKHDGLIPDEKTVIHCNTPSYVGSHVTGFSNMATQFVRYFSEEGGGAKVRRANVIPGWVEPADTREIKRLMRLLEVLAIVFPDTSGILDAPQTGRHEFYPSGGVTPKEMKHTGNSTRTFALGITASAAAASALEEKCGVPSEHLELPIGLRATDAFIDRVRTEFEVAVPSEIERERGRLTDMMTDINQYFHDKRVALWGDPDQLVSLSQFLCDLGARPVYVVTGTPGKAFEARMDAALDGRVPEAKVKQGAGADMFLLHQWIKSEPVDLLIGNTYGKYIARDEDIPLVRHGFPILDRVGHQYFPTVCYQGAIRLIEQMLNALQDRQDRDCAEERFELTM